MSDFDTTEIRKIGELDGTRKIFGWKFHDGGSNGLVTLYLEDDENWFPKQTFDIHWAYDLMLSAACMLDDIAETESGNAVIRNAIKEADIRINGEKDDRPNTDSPVL